MDKTYKIKSLIWKKETYRHWSATTSIIQFDIFREKKGEKWFSFVYSGLNEFETMEDAKKSVEDYFYNKLKQVLEEIKQ